MERNTFGNIFLKIRLRSQQGGRGFQTASKEQNICQVVNMPLKTKRICFI
jgi:hypothetical protein